MDTDGWIDWLQIAPSHSAEPLLCTRHAGAVPRSSNVLVVRVGIASFFRAVSFIIAGRMHVLGFGELPPLQ